MSGSREEGVKRCPGCGKDEPVSQFTRDKRRWDGLSFYCRNCRLQRERTSLAKRRGRPPMLRRAVDIDVPADHKWCPDCDRVKPLEEFPRNRNTPNGRAVYCKPCHNARGRAALEKVGGARTYHLKRRYGVTAAEVEAMVAAQGGRCAVCREAPAEHVDHDHRTGRVRGVLCFNCNGGLGQFRDRDDLMARAIAYLQGATWPELLDREGISLGISSPPESLLSRSS